MGDNISIPKWSDFSTREVEFHEYTDEISIPKWSDFSSSSDWSDARVKLFQSQNGLILVFSPLIYL